LETLGKDWSTPIPMLESPTTATLRTTALAETDVRQDGSLRLRTELETQALLAYLNGALEIPHAPNFLKATMPLLQRAMMEQFHEMHIETALTADISPWVKLRRSMTHHALSVYSTRPTLTLSGDWR
jgi:hypothetical protein